jgi:hypothetical protein
MSWYNFFDSIVIEEKELIDKAVKLNLNCLESADENKHNFKKKHRRHRAVNNMCYHRARVEIKRRDSWLFDSLMKSLKEASEYINSKGGESK